MITKKNLLHLFRIRAEELKITILMFFFSFFIGIVQNILASVPLAMFLTHYKSTHLPYVYIGAGLAMCFIGVSFHYLQRVTSTFNVFAIPIGLFSFSLFAFWGILFVIESPWIFVALLIWSTMLVFFSVSIMIVFSNQLFTTQQTKRLFGLLLAGLSLGGILVGIGMDFLVTSIGAKHLILLTALCLLCALIIQFFVRAHSYDRLGPIEHSEKEEGTEISFGSFKDKKYVLSVFSTTALIFFIFFSFDLLLNTIAQKHYPDEQEIAVFFSLLYAVYDCSNILAGFVLFPWILSRFGLNAALVLLPMTLAVLLSIVFITNWIDPLSAFLFPLLIITAVLQSSMFESITVQSILLLFQPLRIGQRTWAQLTNETFIAPLAISVVGILLLLSDTYFNLELPTLTLFIIGFCVAVLIMMLFVLKKGYLKLLVESLTKSMITKPQFSKLDKDSFALLKSHLSSPYPDEVIYMIQAIENINHREFENVLLETLNNPSTEVRCFSLNKIEQHRILSMEEPVKRICAVKEDPEVLSCALLALGSITGSAQLSLFKNYLYDSNPEIVGSSLIAFLKYGSSAEKNQMVEILNHKAHSPHEADRLMASHVLTHAKIPNEIDLIVPLLKDASLEVRIIASIAAHRISDEKVFSALIDNLALSHTRDSALTSLVALGSSALHYIIQNFKRFSLKIQVELIELIGFIKDPKSAPFLLQILPSAKGRSFYASLQSLKKLSFKADDKSKIWVKKLLKAENNKIIQLKEIVISLKSENTKLLHDLLCREIELSQDCCFSLLDFIYPEASMTKVQHGLVSGDHDLHSNAVELLLHTLSKKDQKLYLEQLVFSPYKADHGSELSIEKTEEFLKKITDTKTHYYITELSAAAIYTMGVLGLKNLLGFIQQHESREDPLMKENVAWALSKLSD